MPTTTLTSRTHSSSEHVEYTILHMKYLVHMHIYFSFCSNTHLQYTFITVQQSKHWTELIRTQRVQFLLKQAAACHTWISQVGDE